MGTIQDKLDLTLNNKNSIKNAIRSKGIEVTDEEPFSSYADKISTIETGIDTSDATATAEHILTGKVAYANGKRIVGDLEDFYVKPMHNPFKVEKQYIYDKNQIKAYIKPDTAFALRADGYTVNYIPYSDIATAIELTSDKIVEGNTVLDVEGSASSGSGAEEYFVMNKMSYAGATNETNGISRAIKTIPLIDTSKITDMSYMFHGSEELTHIPKLNTSNVTNMTSMFALCKKLTSIPLLDTSKVTKMELMFSNCIKITEIPQLNTSNVTSMRNMFHYCSSLKTVPELDASNINIIMNIFAQAGNIENIGGFKNLGKAYTIKKTSESYYTLTLSNCTKLTHDSLMNVINNLYDLNLTYDVANGGTLYTQQLVLGSTNKAKLTAEEIAIATNKGWTVS